MQALIKLAIGSPQLLAYALDVFDDARQETPVIVELLAVGGLDAIPLTDKLVVSTFVDILKAAPATEIVDGANR
jgi:hypothetical protein